MALAGVAMGTEPVVQEQLLAESTPAHVSGIRGWLLMLCIVLCVACPLGTCITIGPVLTGDPIGVLTSPAAAASLAISLAAVWTGSRLWMVKPRAVPHARKLLLLFVVTAPLLANDWRPALAAIVW